MTDTIKKYSVPVIKSENQQVTDTTNETDTVKEPSSDDITLGTLVRTPENRVGIVVSFSNSVTTGIIDPNKDPQIFDPEMYKPNTPERKAEQEFLDHASLPKCLVLMFDTPLWLQGVRPCAISMYHQQDLMPMKW